MRGRKRLLFVVTIAFIIIIVCAICTQRDVTYNKDMVELIPENVQQLSDKSEEFEFIIDKTITNRSSMVFFTSHQQVEVYADGARIYTLENSGGIWGNTTGNVWNFVRIPLEATTIKIHMTPCYPEVEGQIKTFYLGTGYEIYTGVLRQSMPAFIVSVFILMVGIFMSLYWAIIHKVSHIDDTLLFLGIFSIVLGLWTANETDVASLMLVNRQASAFAAFVLLMVMPIPFIMFVKGFLEIKENRYWKLICDINGAVMLINFILNFAGIYEFRRSLWMTHAVIVLIMIYMFVVMTYKIVKRQVDRRLKSCMAALGLIFVAVFGDLVGYYRSGNSSGVFGRMSFLVFIIVLGIEAAKQTIISLKKGRRAEELEQFALNDSMTGLYNRNAYNYFVSSEPDIADHMIVTFDLNNLKKCNDTYGHSSGDAYIINAARIIENNFDKFGKCYRIGGDEFCCIIQKARRFNIERFIQQLHQDVEIFNNRKIIPIEVGIACGYARVTTGDTDIEKVRERADEMMYKNKKEIKEHAREQ